MRDCIDENEALAYRNGEVGAEGRLAIEAHIDMCSACLELILFLGAEGRPMDSSAPALPATGDRMASYAILEEIGSGGMGVVYKAYDLELDRRFALKVVRRGGSEAAKRIRREAQAMARLSHPNVITVYGVHTLADDEVVIAMEYFAGVSLRKWLAARPDLDWGTIQRVFIQAGAGLAAAHEAGLIHRDFKPDNLLVTDDGRVKVIDFGLVSAVGESGVRPETESGDAFDPSLTRTGAYIGTPAYMAPEHYDSGVVDSRTDQFAFCVTLFESVYGKHPFSVQSPQALKEKVLSGDIEFPERRRGVPRLVEILLRRGLSTNPDERFVSMRDLIAALERATEAPPWYRKRAAWAAVAVAALTTVLLVPHEPPCPTPTEAFTDFWSPQVKAGIRRAFRATGLRYADDAWAKAMPRLDAFATSWRAMHVESCQATRVRHEQTAHVRSLRQVCLQEQKEMFRSVIDLLSAATLKTVDRSAELSARLSVERCGDVAALLAVAPPENVAVAASATNIRNALMLAQAQYEIGAYEEGLAASEAAVRDAEAAGYPVVVGEAQYWRGRFLSRTGDYAGSAAALERAYRVALEANHLNLAADASRELTWVVGYYLAKPEQGFQWSISARGLARLRDARGLREARSLARLGKLEAFMGRSRDAQTHLQQSEALFRRHLDDAHPDLSTVVMDLGTSFFGEGRYREALVHYRRGLALRRSAYGARHVRVGDAHQNVGIALLNLESLTEAERSLELARDIYARSGKGPTYEEGMLFHNLAQIARRRGQIPLAIERYSRSLQILQDKLGVDHPRTSTPLRGLGDAKLAAGDVSAAVQHLERAVQLSSGEGHDPGYRANAEFALARALHQAKKSARARRLAISALDRYQDRGLSDDAERVQTWLVEHGYKVSD
ncbi:MAG: serine/threonine-protein kinase [Myxococcota bacterium]